MTCLVCGYRFKARRVLAAMPSRLRWQDDGIPLLTINYPCEECAAPWYSQVWGFALMGREVPA